MLSMNKHKLLTVGVLLLLVASLLYFIVVTQQQFKSFKPLSTLQRDIMELYTPAIPVKLPTKAEILSEIMKMDEFIIIDTDTDNEITGIKLEMEDLGSYVTKQRITNFARISSIFHPVNSVEADRQKRSGSASRAKQNEEFTIVMMTYKRTSMMLKLLKHLSGLPKLNQLLLIWNNNELPGPEINWPSVSYRIRLLTNNKNTLHNRYLPLSIIKTEAIFLLDDDSFVFHRKVLQAFEIWQDHRDQIVGFKGRGVNYMVDVNGTGKWRYNTAGPVSLVLTGSAFIHRNFMELYTYEMPQEMRQIIDETMNCDDLAINFLVSDRVQKGPIFIEHEGGSDFLCPGCVDKGLWKDSSHFKERSNCVNQFAQILGYMPLFKQDRKTDLTLKSRLECSHWRDILSKSLEEGLTTSNTHQAHSCRLFSIVTILPFSVISTILVL